MTPLSKASQRDQKPPLRSGFRPLLAALNVRTRMKQIKGNRVKEYLEENCVELATDESGWETLYQDKSTKELWVRTFPDSHLHGGGLPLLTLLSESEAKAKFKTL